MSRAREIQSIIIQNSKTEEQVSVGGGRRKVEGKLELEALNVKSKGNQE